MKAVLRNSLFAAVVVAAGAALSASDSRAGFTSSSSCETGTFSATGYAFTTCCVTYTVDGDQPGYLAGDVITTSDCTHYYDSAAGPGMSSTQGTQNKVCRGDVCVFENYDDPAGQYNTVKNPDPEGEPIIVWDGRPKQPEDPLQAQFNPQALTQASSELVSEPVTAPVYAPLTPPSPRDQIAELYRKHLGREASPGELDWQAGNVQNGIISLEALSGAIESSAEARARTSL